MFNSYVWKLYKSSDEGKKAIDTFSNLLRRMQGGDFSLNLGNINYETKDGQWQADVSFAEMITETYSGDKVSDISEALTLFGKISTEWLTVVYTYDDGWEEEGSILEELIGLSVGLYTLHPEYFFPYFFMSQFYLFQQICEAFDIPLSEIPKKGERDKRIFYYFELCRALYEFRKNYDLSPTELCAFLYSFAPNFVAEETGGILPEATRVWIVGGGTGGNMDFEFVDAADENTVSRWQGNVDTRRGDIVLMYCVGPRSYIHSIWRAKTDGFIDPFFYFYNTIWICNPIKTAHVTYQELKNDSLLSQMGLVRGSMQGINGRAFTAKEYKAVLAIMARKGQDVSILPKVDWIPLSIGEDENVESERDVEIRLVEPLLTRLGYEKKDWIRQMTIRMGRGERYYPDYAFFAREGRGKERAKMILETKYRMTTEKELFEAYCQAKSYALRLQSKIFALAAMEGIWIFPFEESKFDFENHHHKTWIELERSDVSALRLIGKEAVRRLK